MSTSIASKTVSETEQAQVLIEVVKGQPMTTSLDVAAHFGKRHDNVIKAIRMLECPADFTLLNFEECSRPGANNKPEPFYRMTRDGFAFLCMGFTGKEAARWKIAYITAFNRMEQAIKAQPHQPDERAVLIFALKTLELMRSREAGQPPKPSTTQVVQNYLNIESLDHATAEQVRLALTFVQGQIIGEGSAAKSHPGVAGTSIAKDLLYGLLRTSHDAELMFNALYDSGVETLASEAFKSHMARQLADTSRQARELLGYVASFGTRKPYQGQAAKDPSTH